MLGLMEENFFDQPIENNLQRLQQVKVVITQPDVY